MAITYLSVIVVNIECSPGWLSDDSEFAAMYIAIRIAKHGPAVAANPIRLARVALVITSPQAHLPQ
jgi:hypothetical protein